MTTFKINFPEIVTRKIHSIEFGTSTSKRLRSITKKFRLPLTRAPWSLVITESILPDNNKGCDVLMSGSFHEVLMGDSCLTEPMLEPLLSLMFSLAKHELIQEYTELEYELSAITLNQCEILDLEQPLYFKFDTPEDVIQQYLDIQSHCEVMLDGQRYSMAAKGKKCYVDQTVSRISKSKKSRWEFHVELPFGRVSFSTILQSSNWPEGLKTIEGPTDQEKVLPVLKCLLQATFHVNLKDFQLEGNILPSNPMNWTKTEIPNSPFQLIWDAVLRELWLNLIIPKNVQDVDQSQLKYSEQEVLGMYFNAPERNLLNSNRMKDPIDRMKIHTNIINKTGINMEVPWVILKNNRSEIGDQLARFINPSEVEPLSRYTLTRAFIAEQVERLENAIEQKRLSDDWP
ncbi:hypothetical protein [Limnohabitans sp. 2KL-17]|uniref:hypothetical protein n=1 Tax=Limnohabitans sp. 2KL-17 TaxID=1100704 RepID=UPI0011B2821E|nr:hypothetical protein [Limnohabitans sp. 2KL-17]